MKRSRFSEEQIVGVLKEAEAGVPVKDLCRRVGVSEAAFYHWKAKYGGLEVNETRRLRQLEEENGRLKKIVAQQALDLDALKVVLAKSGRPARRNEKRRYEANLERSFDRTLSQLERRQRMRLGQPVLPEITVHHSLS